MRHPLPPPGRTLRLLPERAAGTVAAAPPLRWPDAPAEGVLDYALDLHGLVAEEETFTATVATPGLALVSQRTRGRLLVLWLGNGTAGTDNAIDVQITTSGGQFVHRVVRLLTR